jgi:hypothetical protein
MTKGKYNSRIIENGATWTAEITRRISARKTGVSKSEEGFSSEAAAQAWVEKELPVFLKNLGEQNKR